LAETGYRISGGEVMGKYYIRKGPWKMVHMPPPEGTGKWQLYNIEKDPSESKDLASIRADITKDMTGEWERYASTNNVILPDWVSGY
jgi:arylsulfatase